MVFSKKLLKGGSYMKKLFIALVLMLAVVIAFSATPALAATSQNVEITATPAYVSISNTPSSYDFGVVQTSTNYSTTQGYFTVTNSSTVAIDCTVATNASSWAGGNTWTHSDAGTPGSTTAALYASNNTASWSIIVKNGTPNNIVNAWPASTNWTWELRLCSPTALDDGVEKSIKVVLTASATS